jgi:hypothetical protein
MPPAFILSHDQTLKFMFHAGAGGMTDVGTVHFKEPLCTKVNDPSDRSRTGRSYSNYEWIREKDCENGLAF